MMGPVACYPRNPSADWCPPEKTVFRNVVFHQVTGRWTPACLRAATASVETVSPPQTLLFYHLRQEAEGRPFSVVSNQERGRTTLWMPGFLTDSRFPFTAPAR
jgi:hypothetical protein